MKDEVIIVQRAQDNIAQIIQEIKIDELVFINIVKTIFERDEIMQVKDLEYKLHKGGYQFNFLIIKDSDWYALLKVIDTQGENIYSLLSYNILFYLEGKSGYRTVYIKEEGSKAKIDEE